MHTVTAFFVQQLAQEDLICIMYESFRTSITKENPWLLYRELMFTIFYDLRGEHARLYARLAAQYSYNFHEFRCRSLGEI
jgi:hypothetical protein